MIRRRPRSLRTRLVVAAVALIAVVCAVISTVTAVALRSHLYEQLDHSLDDVAMRAAGPPHREADPHRRADPLVFVRFGPQELGTIGASLKPDGTIGKAVVSTDDGAAQGSGATQDSNSGDGGDGAKGGSGAASGGSERPLDPAASGITATPLAAAQLKALDAVPRDGRPHSLDVPGLGGYRAEFRTGANGTFLVGVPTAKVDTTVRTLVVVEVCVTAAGLVAATLAGAVMAQVALRPLRRVAATATRVAELPLHRGEVTLRERVPDADGRTEVGQVGAALNRMLDHVHEALQERQRSETRVRQFVADASHELRTPLTSILGYAELTRRSGEMTGPDTGRALERIESEAGRMAGLVEDLLLLARLDAGRPLSRRSADLRPLVADMTGDARAARTGQGHLWRLDLPGEAVTADVDTARLRQVLANLLANARTHTPPGTTVTARVRDDGARVCVEVEDDGPGIPAELLPHVFERFARGDASRSRTAGGGAGTNGSGANGSGSTGLGLAIVRAVVTAHGGETRVASRPGRTVFTVDLPAAHPRPAPTCDPGSEPASEPGPEPAPTTSQPHHSPATHL